MAKALKVPMASLKVLWYRMERVIKQEANEDIKNIIRLEAGFSRKSTLIADLASLTSLAPMLLSEAYWRYVEVRPGVSVANQDSVWNNIWFLEVDRKAFSDRRVTENWKRFIAQFRPYTMEMINSTVPEVCRLGWWLNNEIISAGVN